MIAKTTAERQRALRQARAEAGLVEVRGVWLTAEQEAKLKRLIKAGKLNPWIDKAKV